MSQIENPWCKIPAEDYEGHMSAAHVAQLPFLKLVFREVVEEFLPNSLLILGCTTGNGFEVLQNKMFDKVIGVDINKEYIDICRKRYSAKIPPLQLICDDVENIQFENESFDLIYAALFFEYVEVNAVLNKISRWLKHGGILSVVLQLHGDGIKAVSQTNYESILSLVPFIKLVDESLFIKAAEENDLLVFKQKTIELESGKKFSLLFFKRK